MSKKIEVNGVNLDWKAREVLEAVVEDGGESDTSGVKDYTGIESNMKVKYRFEKLEDAGLVEKWQPEPEGGQVPPKRVKLTEEGEHIVESGELEDIVGVDPGDEGLSLGERVERLEQQTDRMRERYGDMRELVVSLREDVEGMEDEVDGFDGELDTVMERLDRLAEIVGEDEEGVDIDSGIDTGSRGERELGEFDFEDGD